MDERRKGHFYPAPEADPGDVPAWMLAGGALLIVVAMVLVIAGGIVVGGMVLEAVL